MSDYHPQRKDRSLRRSKPDIPPDQRWRIPMKTMILAAFAALSLGAAIVPLAQAAPWSNARAATHQGPYDNTANTPGNQYVGSDN
jgi:hypothetical protein